MTREEYTTAHPVLNGLDVYIRNTQIQRLDGSTSYVCAQTDAGAIIRPMRFTLDGERLLATDANGATHIITHHWLETGA